MIAVAPKSSRGATAAEAPLVGPGMRLALRIAAGVGLLAVLFHVAHGQLGLGGSSVDSFTYDWLYDAVIISGSVSCLTRAALVRRERVPWLIFGVGLAFNATGEVYYSLAFGDSGNVPIPSLADLFYLLYYPCAYVAMVLLVRARVQRFSASRWLDGAIAATTSAAVIASVAFEPIASAAKQGSAAAIATNFAYPVGDLILFSIVIGAFGLANWRPGRGWLLLGIGLAASAIADTSYLYTTAHDTYAVGGWIDTTWLVAALAIGSSAWQPSTARTAKSRLRARRVLLIPVTFAFTALSVLLYGDFHHVGAVGLALAGVTLLLVIMRAGWTFADNVRLLAASRHEAVTDTLTGLGNRRLMNTQLEEALADGEDSDAAVLVMFDLNGFKVYNDRFGHLAGDTLLSHLGRRLSAAVGSAGSAYRPGGDEFCVLLRGDVARADVHIAAARAALSADGEGFAVSASHGVVAIPLEAQTPTIAMRLADDRMYAEKGGRRGSPTEQTHGVLLELLRERQPTLHERLREVGRLSVLVGRRFGMNEEQLDELRRAAELKDIGKTAIPDAILNKPGALDTDEWTFLRRHTLVGERILTAAPALAPVAALVRASRERWDGSGFPDGLAGTAIPLGARIVAVCDAFDGLVSHRPYSPQMSPELAFAELRSEAGTQFDSDVVAAFELAWHEEEDGRFEPQTSSQPVH
ncbi:MAG TPA: HD domain-containing phosphohydrolase [Solirubrobacteraceae bacterium]